MTITPKQFDKLVTKDDLKKLANKKEMHNKFDQVLTAVDGLAKKFDNFHAEMAANQAAHDRFESSISDLKKRVRLLERKSV
jgi:hypothetical protein